MTERSAAHPFELVAAALLGGALIVAVWLMLVGAVAGAVFGGGPAVGELADMPAVLVRLPSRLDHPRRAWPPEERRKLPGPLAIYGTAAGSALLLIVGGLALGARIPRGPRRAPAARWARRREARVLRTSEPQPGRITLGRAAGGLLAAERSQSAIVIAPTQTGKTTALAIPAILEWQGPVLAVSVKSDLLRDSLRRRMDMGDVAVFDPTESAGVGVASSWTPLARCRDWAGARQTAAWLTEGAVIGERSLADGDFWYAAAGKLLAPLLYAAATSKRQIAHVVTWLDKQEHSEVQQALEEAGSSEAITAWEANWNREDRQRSSIYTTAETVLEAYADPGVLKHSRTAEITPERLLGGGMNTLYLCAGAREQRRLRPVFVTLLQEVLEAAYLAASRRGAPLYPPLLVVLDEVANIAPLPDLDVLASTGPGHGVQLLTVLQDLAQAQDRWGPERADTIVNNHRAKILGSGISDARTLEHAMRLLGDAEVRQQSSTRENLGRHSVTEASAHRPLLPGHRLRELPAGNAILVYGNLPPIKLRLRPWYADPSLRRMVS